MNPHHPRDPVETPRRVWRRLGPWLTLLLLVVEIGAERARPVWDALRRTARDAGELREWQRVTPPPR